MRQLHHLDINITVDIRLTVVQRQQLIHARCRFQQGNQVWLRHDDSARSNPSHHADKPDELHGVTHTVITMNQHTPPLERRAIPDRL